MVDLVLSTAAKVAAIEALRGYHVQYCAQNERAYLESNTVMGNHSVYRTGHLSPEAIGRAAGDGVRKAVGNMTVSQAERLYKAQQREKAEKQAVIKELTEQAEIWRQKALDGKWSGMPGEIQELYLRKAQAAEDSAGRMERALDNPPVGAVTDETEQRAQEYDRLAAEAERKSLDTSLNPSLRAYYRDRQREHENSANALRGLPIKGEAPQPVNRSVSFVI